MFIILSHLSQMNFPIISKYYAFQNVELLSNFHEQWKLSEHKNMPEKTGIQKNVGSGF